MTAPAFMYEQDILCRLCAKNVPNILNLCIFDAKPSDYPYFEVCADCAEDIFGRPLEDFVWKEMIIPVIQSENYYG